jgi:hypothetical protein
MKRYADDYEIAYEMDKKGREKKVAVYKGIYFQVNVDEPKLVKFKRISQVLTLLIVAFQIASGFVANRGMYLFYVAMPYVFAFLPTYFLTAGVFRLPTQKRKFRRDEVGLSFERMKKASVSLLILLVASVLGEMIFLLVLAETGLTQEYIFLALQVLAALGTFIIIRLQQPVEVTACIE